MKRHELLRAAPDAKLETPQACPEGVVPLDGRLVVVHGKARQKHEMGLDSSPDSKPPWSLLFWPDVTKRE